jgi:predicted SnoaL-like aldol condensation-catalyzing enzyme
MKQYNDAIDAVAQDMIEKKIEQMKYVDEYIQANPNNKDAKKAFARLGQEVQELKDVQKQKRLGIASDIIKKKAGSL